MGALTKTVTTGCALAGLAIFSQAPEFAQQYRQRLGGAVDELRAVVADFDKDALDAGRTRTEALGTMQRNNDEFVRSRSTSMAKTINRFESLRGQQAAFEAAHPLWRPLLVFGSPDEAVIDGAWQIFEPAVPLTRHGMSWGGIGAFLAGLAGFVLTRPFRRRRRQEQHRRSRNQPPLLDEISSRRGV